MQSLGYLSRCLYIIHSGGLRGAIKGTMSVSSENLGDLLSIGEVIEDVDIYIIILGVQK